MGLIRFLLAFAVVISHNISCFGLTFIGSIIAVQAFYVISSFYMGLILDGKYSSKNYFLFISNRLLRLLPIYWVMLVLIILLSILWYNFSESGNTIFFDLYDSNNTSLSFSTWILILFADVFVVFQDLFLFLGVSEGGGIQLISNFRTAASPLSDFLIIPQAWTIGLEIMFYFLVPFIIKLSNRYIIIIAVASLVFRFIFYYKGLDFDPWTYRFFPFEIFFFLIGILSFRLYLFISTKKIDRRVNLLLFYIMVIYILIYQFIPFNDSANKVLFFLLLTFFLPFIFTQLKTNRFDRMIGEFSYPVYLSHIFVSIVIEIINSKVFHFQKTLTDSLIIVSTIVFSFILIKFISEPIEKLRQRRVAERNNNLKNIV
jgi:peptidoglycan/LPS O-acetylase OafA/YrhL